LKVVLKKRQTKDLKEVIRSFAYHDIVIWAASTGYGKTVCSWKFIEQILGNKQDVRILVLTHGRKELRQNFTNSIAAQCEHTVVEGPADIKKAYSANLVITLPQTVSNYLPYLGQFDFLVCDEAHQYYSAATVTNIIEQLNIQKHLLLTNSHYGMTYPKVYCSRENLVEDGEVANVGLCIVPTKFSPDFYQDYVAGSLKEGKEIPKSLLTAIKKMITKDKTMIMCHSVKSADHLQSILKETYECAVSHYISDAKCTLLHHFKTSKMHVLIVIDRGSIGFDYPELGTVIDLTFSKNIERLEQIYGRLCRKSKKDIPKTYHKIVPKIHEAEFKVIMSGVLALGVDEIYRSWDGRDATLRLVETEWLSQNEGDSLEVERDGFYNKYMETFSGYCTIFKKSKDQKHAFIDLATALKRIRNRTPWITYKGCKITASDFASIADWRSQHRISHNFAYYRQWIRPIAMQLEWETNEPWLYDECLVEAKECLDLNRWAVKYPDSYGFAAQESWLEFISQDMDWVL